MDELNEIARLGRIKNREKLTKESNFEFLKSESSAAEQNLKKRFNNDTNDDTNDDGKTRDKISDINMILSRLGNTVTK